MELIFVILAVVVCVVWQISSYNDIRKKISSLRGLFPYGDDDLYVNTIEETNTTTIYCQYPSTEFKQTLDDINKYLLKNKDKTFDYQIIKEIVERNVSSLENEVDTLLPSPLYIGLMATIVGIAFGVVFFAQGGDLANLIIGREVDASGIQALLTDVGIAMIATFIGVLVTKLSTQTFNDARTEMTRNKNTFLTWIQSELMPKIPDDITGAIKRMTDNLNLFNYTFAQNTNNLSTTFAKINENYDRQTALLTAIKDLNIEKIAQANVDFCQKLTSCSNSLDDFNALFNYSRDYIEQVKELNKQLGDINERTQAFELIGEYFKNEMDAVKKRIGNFDHEMSRLDSNLKKAIGEIQNTTTTSLSTFTQAVQEQNQNIGKLLETQQSELFTAITTQSNNINREITAFDNPFEKLRSAINNNISNINSALDKQNSTLESHLQKQYEMLENYIDQQNKMLQKLDNQKKQSNKKEKLAPSVVTPVSPNPPTQTRLQQFLSFVRRPFSRKTK